MSMLHSFSLECLPQTVNKRAAMCEQTSPKPAMHVHPLLPHSYPGFVTRAVITWTTGYVKNPHPRDHLHNASRFLLCLQTIASKEARSRNQKVINVRIFHLRPQLPINRGMVTSPGSAGISDSAKPPSFCSFSLYR